MNHIALITDDGYVLPTAVCIQSIINSAKPQQKYSIHVCTFGLSEDNVKLLTGLETEKVSILIDKFCKADYQQMLDLISQKSHVTPTALIKFELPQHFTDVDKLLYLDSDIIIKKDLSELFSLDLENFYLAASFEYWVRYNDIRFKPWNVKREEFYFNSGLMLLNLKKFRDDAITEKLWDYKINHTKTKLMDQECLNSVCGQQTLPLSIKWNFNPVFLKTKHLKTINEVYSESYSNLKELEDNVAVIHYVGKFDKPWVYSSAQMREYWQEAFEGIHSGIDLQLQQYVPPKTSRIKRISNMISEYGVVSTGAYICYLTKWKVRRKQ